MVITKREYCCFSTPFLCFVQMCTLPSGTGASFLPDTAFSCVSKACSGVFVLSLWAKGPGQLKMVSELQCNLCHSRALWSTVIYRIRQQAAHKDLSVRKIHPKSQQLCLSYWPKYLFLKDTVL